MVAAASVTANPDGQWREFVLGLLSDGECWIDDLSVVQSPTNGPIQLIANGNFESGLSGWRVLGNHVRSTVEVDPDDSTGAGIQAQPAGRASAHPRGRGAVGVDDEPARLEVGDDRRDRRPGEPGGARQLPATRGAGAPERVDHAGAVQLTAPAMPAAFVSQTM